MSGLSVLTYERHVNDGQYAGRRASATYNLTDGDTDHARGEEMVIASVHRVLGIATRAGVLGTEGPQELAAKETEAKKRGRPAKVVEAPVAGPSPAAHVEVDPLAGLEITGDIKLTQPTTILTDGDLTKVINETIIRLRTKGDAGAAEKVKAVIREFDKSGKPGLTFSQIATSIEPADRIAFVSKMTGL